MTDPGHFCYSKRIKSWRIKFVYADVAYHLLSGFGFSAGYFLEKNYYIVGIFYTHLFMLLAVFVLHLCFLLSLIIRKPAEETDDEFDEFEEQTSSK